MSRAPPCSKIGHGLLHASKTCRVGNENLKIEKAGATVSFKRVLTRNVFKKDKRRQIKKGRKYNTRLSTCT